MPKFSPILHSTKKDNPHLSCLLVKRSLIFLWFSYVFRASILHTNFSAFVSGFSSRKRMGSISGASPPLFLISAIPFYTHHPETIPLKIVESPVFSLPALPISEALFLVHRFLHHNMGYHFHRIDNRHFYMVGF